MLLFLFFSQKKIKDFKKKKIERCRKVEWMASRGTTHGDMCRTKYPPAPVLIIIKLYYFYFWDSIYIFSIAIDYFLKIIIIDFGSQLLPLLNHCDPLSDVHHSFHPFLFFFYSFIHLSLFKSSDVAFLYVSTIPPPS